MQKYVSLLRGINVSGQKKIKMTELTAMYSRIGFQDVVTYIQTGNIIFSAKKSRQGKLKSMIETDIEAQFGFQVPVEIRTAIEMKNIISNAPFDRDKADAEGNKYHVIFLAGIPSTAAISDVQQFLADGEKLFVQGREAYFYCPGSYRRTKLSNNFLEKKFKLAATTRNWKTLNKILALL